MTDSELDPLVQEALDLQSKIEAEEVVLETLRRKQRELLYMTIPEWMNERGLVKAESTKCSLSLKTAVHASIKKSLPQEQRDLAIAWLRKYGGSPIIKDNIVISNGSEEYAKQLRAVGADAVYSPEVNHATLSSFMSDLLGIKKGALPVVTPDEVPAALGLYIENSVTLKEKS